MKRKGEELKCSPVVHSFFNTNRIETSLLGHSPMQVVGFRPNIPTVRIASRFFRLSIFGSH
jgi:hypothetical protein